MKTTQTISLLAIALCIGFFAARWSQAQSTTNTSVTKPTNNDDISIQELESLENYLQDTKQTNAVHLLNDFLADDEALKNAADTAITVSILRGLRNGKTNEVFEFLEGRLDTEVRLSGLEYNGLPSAFQKEIVKSLQVARDYRTKYPSHNSDEFLNAGITNAFRILDEKN